MELITGSDYRLLPKVLVSKRAILNPTNIDHRSCGYAIMFAQNPKDWKEYSSKPSMDIHFEQLGLNKIKYPVLLNKVPACDEQLNIGINVFTFDDAAAFKRHFHYISRKFKPQEVNLLYWKGRYALIKYVSRLLSDVQK